MKEKTDWEKYRKCHFIEWKTLFGGTKSHTVSGDQSLQNEIDTRNVSLLLRHVSKKKQAALYFVYEAT